MDNDKIERCAEAAHEMNRIYCQSHHDFSQVPWVAAPDWQRKSAINGVAGVIAGNTPEQSHESWLAEKISTGWRYGLEKDPVAKTHPCMVGYHELPPEQRRKDDLFIDSVRAMAHALGLELRP